MTSVAADRETIELRADWFEAATADAILRWALCESGLERVAVASSFQAEGTVVLHMAVGIRPGVPVLFIDTGFHFAETLAFKELLTEQLQLNVMDVAPTHTADQLTRTLGPRLYERDPELCCELNKVGPWRRALESLDGWITAMRRDSAWTRRSTPIVDVQPTPGGRRVVKINPVANWTRHDISRYLRDHELPHNPLYDLGFASIGCAPCSRAVLPGEDERAGRWAGTSKVECGIHVAESRRMHEG